MTALYNEIDPKAAAWLRELVRRGLIAPGDVIEASIEDLTPNDLRGYTQCHFFAGIGVWSHALRRAGWPDDRPVWTMSCPCQPFSAAGKGGGFDDERHLWPAAYWLIEQCRPPVILGEQVASKDGLAWLNLVQADVEGAGYAVGAVDTCAAGVGAPHIRQRLYWAGERLANDDRAGQRVERGLRLQRPELYDADGRGTDGRLGDDDEGLEGRRGRHQAEGGRVGALRPVAEAGEPGGLEHSPSDGWLEWGPEPGGRGPASGRGLGGLADTDSRERQGLAVLRGAEFDRADARWAEGSGGLATLGVEGGLADASVARRDEAGQHERGSSPLPARSAEHAEHGGDAGLRADERRLPDGAGAPGEHRLREVALRPGPVNGLWRSADWLYCRDGQWRPVEPRLEPLAHGSPARVGRLRGFGNAIVAPAAQAFIEAYLEAEEDRYLRLTEDRIGWRVEIDADPVEALRRALSEKPTDIADEGDIFG